MSLVDNSFTLMNTMYVHLQFLPSYSSLQASFLPIAVIYCFAIYQRVEIGHPIFALLFQEMVLLSIVHFVLTVLFILSLAMGFFVMWTRVALFSLIAVFQFHQVTWAVASVLR